MLSDENVGSRPKHSSTMGTNMSVDAKGFSLEVTIHVATSQISAMANILHLLNKTFSHK